MWKSIKTDDSPPFNTLVVVRGKDKVYDVWCYALAYNECYQPEMCMIQRFELYKEDENKLPVYYGVPFEIEEWMELE